MVSVNTLSPYISASVCELSGSSVSEIVTAVSADVAGLIGDIDESRAIDTTLAAVRTSVGGGLLHTAGLVYRHTQTPGWAPAGSIKDVKHHLVLVCRRARTVALFTTEPLLTDHVRRRVGDDTLTGLAKLRHVPAATLNGAFLRGDTKTVWLSGVHRRTAHKADSKVLSGTNLRAALEPLGDQTYRFTAARSANTAHIPGREGGTVIVGVSPDKSRLWVGPSQGWNDFASVVWHLLGVIATADELDAPLPVLAVPAKVEDLACPYDLSVIDPILLSAEHNSDPASLMEADAWAHRSAFEVLTSDDPLSFEVAVSLEGATIGSLQVTIDVATDSKVSVAATPLSHCPRLQDAADAVSRPEWLTIRYESGHTVSGGRIFKTRFLDRAFQSWKWAAFTDVGCTYCVTREKPTLSDGRTLDASGIDAPAGVSLFSWVYRNWRDRAETPQTGWLACDDHSGEIADFIHLDDTPGERPLLSLIHVKAALSCSTDRTISTSAYEVVVGQAVKNLRFLDLRHLAAQLQASSSTAAASATWNGGVRCSDNRGAFIARLHSVGTNLDLQVAIVQPHVTQKEHALVDDDRAANRTTSRVKRMRQLDTLLLEAEAACRQINSGFLVIGAL